MYELSDLCCICLCKKDKLHYICHSENEKLTYYVKLTACIPEMRSEEMTEQRLICKECCDIVDLIYRFRKKCLKSKRILSDYISKLQTVSKVDGKIIIRLIDTVQNDIKTELDKTDVMKDDEVKVEENSCHSTSLDNNKENVSVQEDAEVSVEKDAVKNIEENIDYDYIFDRQIETEIDSMCDQLNDIIDNEISMEDLDISTKFVFNEEALSGEEIFNTNFLNFDNNFSTLETCFYDKPQKPEDKPITLNDISQEENFDLCQQEFVTLQFKSDVQENDEKVCIKNLMSVPSCQETFDSNIIDKLFVTKERSHDVNVSDNVSFTKTLNAQKILDAGVQETIPSVEKNEIVQIEFKPIQVNTFQIIDNNKVGNMWETSDERTISISIPNDVKMLQIHTPVCGIVDRLWERNNGCNVKENVNEKNFCNLQISTCQQNDSTKAATPKESSYECSICNKKFSLKSNLNKHTQIHTGEKLHQCNVCHKRYFEKSNLTKHMRTHTGQRPYQCHICQKRFGDKSSLNVHMLIHSGERPYECTKCNRRFSVKSYLKKHMDTHDVKSYIWECDICEVRLSTKRVLVRHMLRHSGEKPYECNLCHKKYTQKYCLIKHMRTHTGERPYECSVCNKKFSVKSYLTKHSLKHTGERPFECNMCNEQFTSSHSLDVHLQKYCKKVVFM